MTQTDAAPRPNGREGIQSWLIDRVAYYVGTERGQIGADVPLADLGLDSVYAFALCGEIDDALGIAVEPTLLWDVETLAELTEHLLGLAAEQPAR